MLNRNGLAKKAEMVDAHCLEVRKYMYHSFVHVLTSKMLDTRRAVRCVLCNGPISCFQPFSTNVQVCLVWTVVACH